jgi:hypothetical protein
MSTRTSEQAGHDHRQKGGDRLLGLDHVGVQPADQGTGLSAGEERDRLLLYVPEHLRAQVVDESFADLRRIETLGEHHKGVEYRKARHECGQGHDQAFVMFHNAVVNDDLE